MPVWKAVIVPRIGRSETGYIPQFGEIWITRRLNVSIGEIESRRQAKAAPTAPSTRRAWLVTGLLFVFMLINFADKAVMGLAAKPMSETFGLDSAEYGHVASSFFLLFSISAVVIGVLANRVPTRWLLVGLAVVWSLSQAPMIWTTSIGVLFASRIVLGAAEGPAFGLANHSLHKWFVDSRRQLPSSVLALGSSVGTLLAAPALTWVIVHHGWREAFAAVAILGLVWCAAWVLLVRSEGPYGAESAPTQAAPAANAAIEDHTSYWRIFLSGTSIGSLALGFAAYFGLAISVAWLPRFLQESRGFSMTGAGNATAVFWAVAGLFILGTGILSQRLTLAGITTTWSRGMLSAALVFGGGLCTLAGVMVHSPIGSLILLMIGLGAPTSVFAITQTLAGEIAPVRQRGAVLGVGVGISTLAGVIAPTVMGNLLDSASDTVAGYNNGFTVVAMVCVAAAMVGAALIRPGRDAARLRTISSS